MPPEAGAAAPAASGTEAVEVNAQGGKMAVMPSEDSQSYLPDQLKVFQDQNEITTLRDQAFKDLLERISPLNPEQIVEMRKTRSYAKSGCCYP